MSVRVIRYGRSDRRGYPKNRCCRAYSFQGGLFTAKRRCWGRSQSFFIPIEAVIEGRSFFWAEVTACEDCLDLAKVAFRGLGD